MSLIEHFFVTQKEWPDAQPGQVSEIALCARCGAGLVSIFVERVDYPDGPRGSLSDIFVITPEGELLEPQFIGECSGKGGPGFTVVEVQ